MNLYEACRVLEIWLTAKAHAEVWFMSDTYTFEDVTQLHGIAKKKFKELSLENHPDMKNGGHEKFLYIQEAYSLIRYSSVNHFVAALKEEERATKQVFAPGSLECLDCGWWNDVVNSCMTGSCSGFKFKKPKIRGMTKFAAHLDDSISVAD